ncbi:MAG: APC family permease [Candidatus Binatia bacterium]
MHERTAEGRAQPKLTLARRIRLLLLGGPKDFRDPHIFHRVSLIAFLAWVGLGADGLSSSCYGPEEAFLNLESHRYLALFLAALIAMTVLVISASYSQIIELFPTGGGGYHVASHLLGKKAGVVSGSALIVDYVLTIAISVASGADQLFSFLPEGWIAAKIWTAVLAVIVLILLNLRGIREAVLPLVPVFLTFLITHVGMIVYAVVSNAGNLPTVAAATVADTHAAVADVGVFATIVILLRAFSLGGGTFTGIEAVSNGLQILRAPRVETARRTMRYMATSLAFTASGLLVSYLLAGVHREPGRTLNASLFYSLTEAWDIGGFDLGRVVVVVAMGSAAALLFVAAQAGFLDGPRVLANMAVDFWVPTRFAHLSDRFVTQDGILMMGLSALLILLFTGGDVRVLVVLYAVNVFLTFSLSQLGMVIHWWHVRREESGWAKKLAVNGLGLCFTGLILFAMLALKFVEGAWVTVVITGSVVLLCFVTRRHYESVRAAVQYLDDTFINVAFTPDVQKPVVPDRNAPTAVLMVSGFNGLGLHSLLSIPRKFPGYFKNVVFVEVGVIDSSRFKGRHEIRHLEKAVKDDLREYVKFAENMGFHSESRHALAIDPVPELERLCHELANDFPHTTFFAGKLVLSGGGFFSRFLHNQTVKKVEELLERHGLHTVVLPLVIPAMPGSPSPGPTSPAPLA